jgi:hypothetical protein
MRHATKEQAGQFINPLTAVLTDAGYEVGQINVVRSGGGWRLDPKSHNKRHSNRGSIRAEICSPNGSTSGLDRKLLFKLVYTLQPEHPVIPYIWFTGIPRAESVR